MRGSWAYLVLAVVVGACGDTGERAPEALGGSDASPTPQATEGGLPRRAVRRSRPWMRAFWSMHATRQACLGRQRPSMLPPLVVSERRLHVFGSPHRRRS